MYHMFNTGGKKDVLIINCKKQLLRQIFTGVFKLFEYTQKFRFVGAIFYGFFLYVKSATIWFEKKT